MEGALARLSNANLSPPTTSPSLAVVAAATPSPARRRPCRPRPGAGRAGAGGQAGAGGGSAPESCLKKSIKWFLFKLVCLSAAVILPLSREPAGCCSSREQNRSTEDVLSCTSMYQYVLVWKESHTGIYRCVQLCTCINREIPIACTVIYRHVPLCTYIYRDIPFWYIQVHTSTIRSDNAFRFSLHREL